MQESVIIGFFNNFICHLARLYNHSKTHLILESVSIRLKGMFAESALWNYVKSYERSSRFFENSFLYKAVQGGFNWFLSVIRRFYPYADGCFKCSLTGTLIMRSITGRLLDKLLDRFVFTIGLFIFIHTTVPYDKWHNQYGAALIVLITLLYLIKAAGDVRYGLDLKKLDFALILFTGSVIIAAATSITPASSLKTLVFNSMSFLLIFVMVNVIKTREEIGQIMYWIIGAITMTALYGFWQYINKVPVDPLLVDVNFSAGVGRVYSTMGNPNNYAEYLVLTLPFFAAAFLNSKKLWVQLVVTGLAAFALLNLFFTSSRSSWIGFMVSVFLFIFFKNRKLIPVFIVLGILAIPFLPASITDRLNTIGKDTSSLYRLNIWIGSSRLLGDYWATGVGLGPEPFIKLFNRYTTAQLPAHSHMLPLQIWLELGIAGLLSFIWLMARLVKKGMISIFGKKDEYLNNVIIACIASLAGIFTIGLVEYVWFYPRILTMFWIDAGILMAALNLQYLRPGMPELKD